MNRITLINNTILQNIKSIYSLRKIYFDIVDGKKIYAYTISLKRCNLPGQIQNFCNICKSLLNDNEKFSPDKKCFKISSDTLEIYYYIEIWRKSADKIVFIEDGQLKLEFLHRMSCEQASRVLSKRDIKPINASDYDTHADKYVALAKSLLSQK